MAHQCLKSVPVSLEATQKDFLRTGEKIAENSHREPQEADKALERSMVQFAGPGTQVTQVLAIVDVVGIECDKHNSQKSRGGHQHRCNTTKHFHQFDRLDNCRKSATIGQVEVSEVNRLSNARGWQRPF